MSAAAFFDSALDETAFAVSLPVERLLGKIAFARALVRQLPCLRRNRLLHRDASFQALVHGSGADAEVEARRSDAWEGNSRHRYSTKAASVFSSLLEASSPPAVLRPVAKSRIEAIDGVVATRLLPHVGKKIHKRFVPPLANANAARAILREVLTLRIGAPPLDAEPSPVGWTDKSVSFVTVDQWSFVLSSHVPCIQETTK